MPSLWSARAGTLTAVVRSSETRAGVAVAAWPLGIFSLWHLLYNNNYYNNKTDLYSTFRSEDTEALILYYPLTIHKVVRYQQPGDVGA